MTFLVGFMGLDYIETTYGLPIKARGYSKDIVESVTFLILLYVFGIVFKMIGLSKFFVTLAFASNLVGYLVTFAVGFIALDWLEKQIK